MNKLITAAICISSAVALGANRGGKIDWNQDNSDECLCNKIDIQGPKIVLVNLDDHCQLDDIED